MLQDEKKVYQVREITGLIKGSLESQFDGVWIEGEISNLAMPMSGHCYLTLKDPEAQMRAVVFRYVHQQIKFKLENGQKILCQGKVTVYAPRGEYQLVVTRIEPRGIGALQLAFEQLKKKLQAEGLFSEEHKKPLPLLPMRVGIVTSPTGAAIRDILHVLKRRFANVSVLLVPVKVQGEGAALEIANGIRLLNEYKKVDVMIVGRGGGSLEDLWPFNEEIVARAIYQSQIPVVSAVGHEIDFTISDFVADLRAPTPSAAAEMVVARKDHLEEKLRGLFDSLHAEARYVVEQYTNRLVQVKDSYFFKQPRKVLEPHWQRLDLIRQSLSSQVSHRLKDEQHRFREVTEKLTVLNPLAAFSRGYSLTMTASGKVIRSAAGLKSGEKIVTRIADSHLYSVLERVEPVSKHEDMP